MDEIETYAGKRGYERRWSGWDAHSDGDRDYEKTTSGKEFVLSFKKDGTVLTRYFSLSVNLPSPLHEDLASVELRLSTAHIVMWQPMNTAPKDGSLVLIKEKGRVCIASWIDNFSIGAEDSPKEWCVFLAPEVVINSPDGWMPIPEA